MCNETVDLGVSGAISDVHGACGCAQGIGKLESEMQQLRGNLANFATTMASLRGIASAAPSQCAQRSLQERHDAALDNLAVRPVGRTMS